MKTAVAGIGYVGLVSAAVFADMGHQVIGFDTDKNKIEMLRGGKAPFYEYGLEDLLAKNSDRIRYTADSAEAYSDADIVFIAVPTPERPDGSANLDYVYSCVNDIARAVTRDVIVVVKSTVPMGTNERVQQLFCNLLDGSSCQAEVVSNPEFLAQGTAVNDMLHPSRVVVGVNSERARAIMDEFYRQCNAPIYFMNRESAEMVKYASNDYLALKVSYINEIANLCETLGANIEDVSRGMGADPRIGKSFLNAGIGYGGSCFPKDTKALHWLSSFQDQELKTVKAAIDVNAQQKIILIKKARKILPSFAHLDIAVLGLSFKPGTDDLREAPSIENIAFLLDAGAHVRVWDPLAMPRYRSMFPAQELTYCKTPDDALKGADACFIMTEWPDVKNLSPEVFKSMERPLVFDGRNCYDTDTMSEEDIEYYSIGR